MKFYVCMHNKWNPYSSEVKNTPWIYWILAFTQIQIEKKQQWEGIVVPHAELIGQFANPEMYQKYDQIKKEKGKVKGLKEGEQYYKETEEGIKGGGAANARYDPHKGLVDMNGNTIIPREKYNDMIGIDGVAISW